MYKLFYYNQLKPNNWFKQLESQQNQNMSSNIQDYSNNYYKVNDGPTIIIWAESDSNQRTPPRQGGILTKLDHRPSIILIVVL